MRSFYFPIYNLPVETEETNGTPSVAIADNALFQRKSSLASVPKIPYSGILLVYQPIRNGLCI